MTRILGGSSLTTLQPKEFPIISQPSDRMGMKRLFKDTGTYNGKTYR